MSFWSEHELSNLQVILYVLQFSCYGLLIGVMIGSHSSGKKKKRKKGGSAQIPQSRQAPKFTNQ